MVWVAWGFERLLCHSNCPTGSINEKDEIGPPKNFILKTFLTFYFIVYCISFSNVIVFCKCHFCQYGQQGKTTFDAYMFC